MTDRRVDSILREGLHLSLVYRLAQSRKSPVGVLCTVVSVRHRETAYAYHDLARAFILYKNISGNVIYVTHMSACRPNESVARDLLNTKPIDGDRRA